MCLFLLTTSLTAITAWSRYQPSLPVTAAPSTLIWVGSALSRMPLGVIIHTHDDTGEVTYLTVGLDDVPHQVPPDSDLEDWLALAIIATLGAPLGGEDRS